MSAGGRETATLRQRLAAVNERIEAACMRSGRSRQDVRLVAVSKRHPPEAVRAAYEAGQREFGESYVQELVSKAQALSDLSALQWRFVGHLQRNKAKDVVAVPSCAVDGLSSQRLAEQLARRAERPVEVLIQVNLAAEPQKAGCRPEDVPHFVAGIRSLDHLELRGLMAIPPAVDDPEQSRPWFRTLCELAHAHGLPEVSMGMSHDLEVAIEEGATMVRVGTAIFGPRPG